MVVIISRMFGSSISGGRSGSKHDHADTRPPFSMWLFSEHFNNDIILDKDNILVMSLQETDAEANSKANYTLIDQLLSSYNTTADVLLNHTNSLRDNSTLNDLLNSEELTVLLRMIILSVVLGLLILVTIIGNVFVIAAIILERNLQNVANYLVVSLAVADLFVACLVMPLGAVYEINDGWILGPELCDIWTSCDVLCCTASILHLVAIATDRYWTVTNIDYHNLRTPRRIFSMVFLVWFFAIIVALAPQFGWKDPDYLLRIERQRCMVSQDVIYQIFATCCSFYVPLLMILVLYWKIYKIARKRIKRRTQRLRQSARKQHKDSIMESTVKKSPKICFNTDICESKKDTTTALASTSASTSATTTTTITNTSTAAPSDVSHSTNSTLNVREETEFSTSNFDSKSHGTDLTTVSDENTTTMNEDPSSFAGEICTVSHQVAVTTSTFQRHVTAIILSSVSPRFALAGITGKQQTTDSASRTNPEQKLAKRRQQIEARRERKAAQTLAIITGAFVVCWLPFFVMALLLSLCKTCEIPMVVTSLFLWLGYFNSTLNPIIYTVFNPEFRRAFQRLLFGKKSSATTITMTAANAKTPAQNAMQAQTSGEQQTKTRSKRRHVQRM